MLLSLISHLLAPGANNIIQCIISTKVKWGDASKVWANASKLQINANTNLIGFLFPKMCKKGIANTNA